MNFIEINEDFLFFFLKRKNAVLYVPMAVLVR